MRPLFEKMLRALQPRGKSYSWSESRVLLGHPRAPYCCCCCCCWDGL